MELKSLHSGPKLCRKYFAREVGWGGRSQGLISDHRIAQRSTFYIKMTLANRTAFAN